MARRLAIAAILASIAGAGNVLGHSTGLTKVNVIVESDKGGAVTDLTKDDFEVRVDGQPRPIESFSPGSHEKLLALVVLVDITVSQFKCPCCVALQAPVMSTSGKASGSMSSSRIGDALGEFPIRGVRTEDRVRVGSIGRRTILSGPFQGSMKDITNAWRALFNVPPVEWLGPSPIWDAVYDGTHALTSEAGQRALVLVTDGQASGNQRGVREVALAAALDDVTVSVVAQESMLPTKPLTSMASHGVDPTAALRGLSDLTGGLFTLDAAQISGGEPCFERDPAPHFSWVLERMRLAYELGFTPQTSDGQAHVLEVRVKRPGTVVKARKVFRAGQTHEESSAARSRSN